MCWGTCCPLVNDVLNAIVEVGELDKDAEVSVSVFYCCVYVIIEYLCCRSGLQYKIREFGDYRGHGRKPGIFIVVCIVYL